MSTIDKAVRFFTGMEEFDADAATSGFAPDATYYGIETTDGRIHRKVYRGKQAVRDYIHAWVTSAKGGTIKYNLRNVRGDDQVVMIEWDDVVTSPGRQEYRNRGVLVFDCNAAGQIQDVRAYYDFAPLEEWDFLSKA